MQTNFKNKNLKGCYLSGWFCFLFKMYGNCWPIFIFSDYFSKLHSYASRWWYVMSYEWVIDSFFQMICSKTLIPFRKETIWCLEHSESGGIFRKTAHTHKLNETGLATHFTVSTVTCRCPLCLVQAITFSWSLLKKWLWTFLSIFAQIFSLKGRQQQRFLYICKQWHRQNFIFGWASAKVSGH